MTEKELIDAIEDSKACSVAFLQVMRDYAEESSPAMVHQAVTRAVIAWGLSQDFNHEAWVELVDDIWKTQKRRLDRK